MYISEVMTIGSVGGNEAGDQPMEQTYETESTEWNRCSGVQLATCAV